MVKERRTEIGTERIEELPQIDSNASSDSSYSSECDSKGIDYGTDSNDSSDRSDIYDSSDSNDCSDSNASTDSSGSSDSNDSSGGQRWGQRKRVE